MSISTLPSRGGQIKNSMEQPAYVTEQKRGEGGNWGRKGGSNKLCRRQTGGLQRRPGLVVR